MYMRFFPRAYSKFLSVLLMIRATLYAGAFVTSGGKEQASGILKEKSSRKLAPGFAKEIDWGRGKTLEGKDYCKYIFQEWFFY